MAEVHRAQVYIRLLGAGEVRLLTPNGDSIVLDGLTEAELEKLPLNMWLDVKLREDGSVESYEVVT